MPCIWQGATRRSRGMRRSLALITVAYALSPIDLIPDFIPVIGYLDDLVIIPAAILLTVRRFLPQS